MAKLDHDIKKMTPGLARRELQRVRNALRWHRNTKGNARCWHNDLQLYERTLPDSKPAGRMDQPVAVLVPYCIRYIVRQQCTNAQHTKQKR